MLEARTRSPAFPPAGITGHTHLDGAHGTKTRQEGVGREAWLHATPREENEANAG